MVDIGTMFSKSWEKFSANMGMAIGIYVVGVLVGGFVGGLTLGICGIPIYAGLFKAFRSIQQGKKPDFGDLFSEFSNFGKWFKLWLVMLVIGIVLGIVYFILAITVVGPPIIGLLVGLFLFFTFPLMIDKDMAAFDAVKESFNKVKSNFGALIGPILLAMIVAGAGGLVLGIGALFTAPWMMIAFWIIYDSAYATSSAPAAAPAPDPAPTEPTQD